MRKGSLNHLGDNMEVIQLSDLQERIKANNKKYAHVIEKYKEELSKRNLKQGRVRPRDPVEQRILDSFDKK